MAEIEFKPIWFDSLGAKSSSTLVKTPDVNILIDPGVAAMQPSFPASEEQKLQWEIEAKHAIIEASKQADIVIISHYHFDHFIDLGRTRLVSLSDFDSLYKDKLLLVKNPNEYINNSQRKRAEHFFNNLCQVFGNTRLEEVLQAQEQREYKNPLESITRARDKDFGDYNRRRRELFAKGQKWFENCVKRWNTSKRIPELKFERLEVKFAEGRSYKFGSTRLRFTSAFFHGIEFSRVGWVFATVIELDGEKLIHSSDLNGPVIEDYADWIINENPNVLIMDGPMTYMFGYMVSRTTLNRAIANMKRILQESEVKLIIYDHHLLREPRFRDFTQEIWNLSGHQGKRIITAAEFLGKEPVVLKLSRRF